MIRVVVVDPGHQVPNYDRALTGALAALGHDVTLATAPLLYYDAGPPAPGVTRALVFGRTLGRAAPGSRLARSAPLRRGLRLTTYPFELAAFARRLLADPPDVIHVQWSLVPTLEARVWRRLRAAGIRVVLTAHNVLPHESRPWQPAAWRGLYRSVDRVIVHSRAAARRLAALASLDAAQVAVIPMAADVPAVVSDRAVARQTLGLPPIDPLALFFGHIRPYKGLDLLLDAWPAVRLTLPSARLMVAGAPAGGASAARRLRHEVARRGLADSVRLHLSPVPAEVVGVLFAAADVIALPYHATDDSAVLQAARGYGRAVVATAVGGLPEALAAGGGLLVPPLDPAALADALANVLSDAPRRDTLEAGARAAAQAWTWSDVAAATVVVYRGAD